MTYHLQKINDIFFINERIKDINPNYELFYNTKLKQYEIHDLSNKKCTLCSTQKSYPNATILKKLVKTSKENMQKTIREMDRFNNNLSIKQEHNLLAKANDQLSEIIKYSQLRPNINLSCQEIRKIIN